MGKGVEGEEGDGLVGGVVVSECRAAGVGVAGFARREKHLVCPTDCQSCLARAGPSRNFVAADRSHHDEMGDDD
jgi:hypothetical protein